jgi:molybdate-binding protein/DNA-binding XRE family transcriptional regulator
MQGLKRSLYKSLIAYDRGAYMSQQGDKIICNLRQYRVKNRLSQDELAKIIGIKRQAIYDIESGRYLPNTAIALQLARIFGCRVEDLFILDEPVDAQPVHIINGDKAPTTRLSLAKVRDRLVGIPLKGASATTFGLKAADGMIDDAGENTKIFLPEHLLNNTIILMGCDPTFEILANHISRIAPDYRVHCLFASSYASLTGISDGVAHVAGTHLHNTDDSEANVLIANEMLGGMKCNIFGFSLMEEGLIVAKNNPLGIRNVADLAQPMVRFVNREQGAALRVLLEDELKKAGIPGTAINGYQNEVTSHRDGASKVACNVADAALGLKAVADAFDLGFVPIISVRCDLVIPDDMMEHPTIKILTNALQSVSLRKEIDAIPGYDGSAMGKIIS